MTKPYFPNEDFFQWKMTSGAIMTFNHVGCDLWVLRGKLEKDSEEISSVALLSPACLFNEFCMVSILWLQLGKIQSLSKLSQYYSEFLNTWGTRFVNWNVIFESNKNEGGNNILWDEKDNIKESFLLSRLVPELIDINKITIVWLLCNFLF